VQQVNTDRWEILCVLCMSVVMNIGQNKPTAHTFWYYNMCIILQIKWCNSSRICHKFALHGVRHSKLHRRSLFPVPSGRPCASATWILRYPTWQGNQPTNVPQRPNSHGNELSCMTLGPLHWLLGSCRPACTCLPRLHTHLHSILTRSV